ncbi:MAG TPA: hypothetical protein VFT43_14625, partial [Candidatus Polarisedimenticolia bacterium]|nr:hypothetical protein [Candidatus Polarisedimenticolia bacterium]
MPDVAPVPSGDTLRAILEALVFAAEEPLTPEDVLDLFPGITREAVLASLEDLTRACEGQERGL